MNRPREEGMAVRIFFLISVGLLFVYCKQRGQEYTTLKEAYNVYSTPIIALGLTKFKLDEMPTESFYRQKPWSGDYWPTAKAGIARRWQYMLGENQSDYNVLTREKLDQLTQEQLDKLSPIEKYEVWLGVYKFPYTQIVKNRMWRYSLGTEELEKVDDWEGICDGWAQAAILEPIPLHEFQVKWGDNKKLTFYPADVQALLSEWYAAKKTKIKFMGYRCNRMGFWASLGEMVGGRNPREECRDVNPGAMLLLLGNYVPSERALVGDLSTKKQVWNHPIVGYSFVTENIRELKSYDDETMGGDWWYSYRAKGTFYLADVTLTLHYVVETPARVKNSDDRVRERIYKFTIEMDSEKRILGGEWLQEEHPDFFWVPENDKDSKQYILYKDIQFLLEQSRLPTAPSEQ